MDSKKTKSKKVQKKKNELPLKESQQKNNGDIKKNNGDTKKNNIKSKNESKRREYILYIMREVPCFEKNNLLKIAALVNKENKEDITETNEGLLIRLYNLPENLIEKIYNLTVNIAGHAKGKNAI